MQTWWRCQCLDHSSMTRKLQTPQWLLSLSCLCLDVSTISNIMRLKKLQCRWYPIENWHLCNKGILNLSRQLQTKDVATRSTPGVDFCISAERLCQQSANRNSWSSNDGTLLEAVQSFDEGVWKEQSVTKGTFRTNVFRFHITRVTPGASTQMNRPNMHV